MEKNLKYAVGHLSSRCCFFLILRRERRGAGAGRGLFFLFKLKSVSPPSFFAGNLLAGSILPSSFERLTRTTSSVYFSSTVPGIQPATSNPYPLATLYSISARHGHGAFCPGRAVEYCRGRDSTESAATQQPRHTTSSGDFEETSQTKAWGKEGSRA